LDRPRACFILGSGKGFGPRPGRITRKMSFEQGENGSQLAECPRCGVVLRAMNATDFALLIDANAAPLVLYARQWCDAPEDVVQEAFLKLVRPGRLPADLLAWLYRVVRNGALDAAKIARRRQRRESAAARPVRWFVEPEVDGLDAGTAAAALGRLGAEQREVIVARLWGGLSFEQVGTIVGCSASTAFRRYAAGVEELRKQLGVTCPKPSSNA
jgi:RNA polymerase sigma factor (sigma-70 family)